MLRTSVGTEHLAHWSAALTGSLFSASLVGPDASLIFITEVGVLLRLFLTKVGQ